MAKKVSTHVMLSGLSTIHVALSRLLTLRTFDVASSHGDIGVDLPIYVRREPSDPYQLTTLWIGISHVRKAFVADEHEIEVSDVPFSPKHEDSEPTVTPVPVETDDLTVTL